MLAIARQIGDSESAHNGRAELQSVISVVRGGMGVEIRPIQVDDEERMVKFHQGLSERTVYMRYFESLSLAARTAHPRLSRICFADPEHETVLVAVSGDGIVGVGRLSRLENSSRAELAALVLDKFQGRGIGTALVRQLLQAARQQNLTEIGAEMLRDNIAMQRVLKKADFSLRLGDPRTVRAIRKL